jgi:hypothetical protein
MMYIIEYYSNDNGMWEESTLPHHDYYVALETMRLQASDHPDIPHRIIETKVIRTTVALASQGEELCR